MLRRRVRFGPSRERDRAIADAADVDGALAQNRIVAECLEDALLQSLGAALFLDLVLLELVELRKIVGDGRAALVLRAFGATAADALRPSAEPAHALCRFHPNGQAAHLAQPNA